MYSHDLHEREQVLSRRSTGVNNIRDRHWDNSTSASMKMEQRIGIAALDVEKFSKLGTEDLNNGHPERALESFKYAYKRSRELDDGYTERACAFNLGAVYIALGNNKKGLEILEKSVPPDNKREGRSNGDLYFNFGLGFEGTGNDEEAVRNYKKALDEYKVERDNVSMEAECLEKISRIYVKTRNSFAAETFGQLVGIYEILDNPVKKLEALSEKANQLFLSGKNEDAESAADECINLMENCKVGTSGNFGTIYNDLGLIYTQQQKYDKAASCFEKALPLVRSGNSSQQQEAVILQNLGASYNFLGDYQRAIQFHEEAADLYAKLKIRGNQGQCFANLAFAFSQIGDINSAGEAFLHALQAAKDSGDQRTQWQVCEGLGAVAFHQGDSQKAINYFKRALRLLASTESTNNQAQDRIVTKLTQTLEAEVMAKRPKSGRQRRREVTESPVIARPQKPIDSVVKKQAVTMEEAPPDRRRFIPVVRHGSIRQHEKVARGLSSMSGTMSSQGNYRRMDVIDSSDSEETSNGSESEASQESVKQARQSVNFKKPSDSMRENSLKRMSVTKDRGAGLDSHSEASSISSDEEKEPASSQRQDNQEDEDDDRKAVEEQLKKIQNLEDDPEDSRGQGTADTDLRETREYKHSEDQDESDASSEEEDEEFEVPPVPTKSPPQSSLIGTYESPHGVFKKYSKQATNSESSTQRGHSNEDDPTYQTINTKLLLSSRDKEGQNSPDGSGDEAPPTLVPRGVRDESPNEETQLYLQHQKIVQEKQKAEEQASATNRDSKTCSIM